MTGIGQDKALFLKSSKLPPLLPLPKEGRQAALPSFKVKIQSTETFLQLIGYSQARQVQNDNE